MYTDSRAPNHSTPYSHDLLAWTRPDRDSRS
nr:MAG TPA: hypothetical protein [Bacteriophage sp.]